METGVARVRLMHMKTQRERVSYALARRNTLESMRGPESVMLPDPCDAQPLLVTSALNHGDEAEEPCPVCASDHLLFLRYVFGDQLGQFSGRIKSLAELAEMETQFGEFKVRVVEVCPDCKLNFMIESFSLGDGIKRRPPRRQQTVEDIYG